MLRDIGGWLTNYKRFNVLPESKRLDITIGDMEHFRSYINIHCRFKNTGIRKLFDPEKFSNRKAVKAKNNCHLSECPTEFQALTSVIDKC